jgi:hypothetical protein
MRLRCRSIARWMLVAGATSLVLAACGGGDGTTEAAGSPTAAAATTEPAGQADPLEGEWRAEYTCKDSVRAIQSHLSMKQINHQGGSLESIMGEWGGQPTKDDPCNAVHRSRNVVARFAAGNLGLFNTRTGELMADAEYELVDDHSFRVGAGALCYPPLECPVTWQFDIADDVLTFQVGPEVYQIMNWEAAPFHRVS